MIGATPWLTCTHRSNDGLRLGRNLVHLCGQQLCDLVGISRSQVWNDVLACPFDPVTVGCAWSKVLLPGCSAAEHACDSKCHRSRDHIVAASRRDMLYHEPGFRNITLRILQPLGYVLVLALT